MKNNERLITSNLPQAIDLEEAVLGAMLIDKSSIYIATDLIVSEEVFFKESHKVIFNAVVSLFRDGEPVDILTVSERLKKHGDHKSAGGDVKLIELSQKVASTAHIEHHIRIILEKYLKREIIKNSNKTLDFVYDDDSDVFESLDLAYSHLNKVSEAVMQKQDSKLSDIVTSRIDRGEKIYRGEIKSGLTTPISRLTQSTGGYRDSELIILAARPGMGKTSYVLSSALHLVKQMIPVGFFTLEMSKEQLVDKLISMEGRIDNEKFSMRGLNEEDVKTAKIVSKRLGGLPLYIDDTANVSIERLKAKAQRLKAKYDIKILIVDYLQLMTSTSVKKSRGNREQEISTISRGLKLIAKELNIPVIALSQLSRDVEKRGGSKRPMLSDLRESGAIEQDADMVMFLYRPEYYGITEWDDDYGLETTDGQCEYIVAKNRNGGLARNRMKFEARYTLFSDLDGSIYNSDLPTIDTSVAF